MVIACLLCLATHTVVRNSSRDLSLAVGLYLPCCHGHKEVGAIGDVSGPFGCVLSFAAAYAYSNVQWGQGRTVPYFTVVPTKK